MHSEKVTKIHPRSHPFSKDEGLKGIGHSMNIGNLISGANSVAVSSLVRWELWLFVITKCDRYYYKMRQLFYYKMQQFYYKMWQFATVQSVSKKMSVIHAVLIIMQPLRLQSKPEKSTVLFFVGNFFKLSEWPTV